jgi:hypothetical protein
LFIGAEVFIGAEANSNMHATRVNIILIISNFYPKKSHPDQQL